MAQSALSRFSSYLKRVFLRISGQAESESRAGLGHSFNIFTTTTTNAPVGHQFNVDHIDTGDTVSHQFLINFTTTSGLSHQFFGVLAGASGLSHGFTVEITDTSDLSHQVNVPDIETTVSVSHQVDVPYIDTTSEVSHQVYIPSIIGDRNVLPTALALQEKQGVRGKLLKFYDSGGEIRAAVDLLPGTFTDGDTQGTLVLKRDLTVDPTITSVQLSNAAVAVFRRAGKNTPGKVVIVDEEAT